MRKKAKGLQSTAGFTLIELVAVVGILLVLIVALLPRMEANRRSSNDTIVQGYLREIQKYQEMYYGFNRQYANSLNALRSLVPPIDNPPTNPPVTVNFITTGVDYNREYCVIAGTTAGQYWYQATSKGVRARTNSPVTGAAPTSCDFTLY
ncbi:type II secretion system protein [Thermus hydrothermalis]|uniref:type II secretion system protein n=1 Tax=Thermus hydrothermalis TaxID=2908148 RepID=UPI001FA98026|nr:pilus assembly protein PilA [Thermus hydrothermalis]